MAGKNFSRKVEPSERRNYKCRVCGSVLETIYREILQDGKFHLVPARGKCPTPELHPPRKYNPQKGSEILERETARWYETHDSPPWKVMYSKWWTYSNKWYMLKRWAKENNIFLHFDPLVPTGHGGLAFVPHPDTVTIPDVKPGSDTVFANRPKFRGIPRLNPRRKRYT